MARRAHSAKMNPQLQEECMTELGTFCADPGPRGVSLFFFSFSPPPPPNPCCLVCSGVGVLFCRILAPVRTCTIQIRQGRSYYCYSTVGCRRTCCRRTTRLKFQDFLRTCQARNLKIRTVWMCADLALCTTLKRAALVADKNVNQLELRKLRTVPGYDAGPHVLQHLTVL